MYNIKKWQKFSKEELEQFVKESKSLKELAQKCGYSSDQGRISIKKMLKEYGWEEPRQIEDLTNQTFGKLKVLYRVDKYDSKGYKLIYWHCKCDCGNECDVYAGSLKAVVGTKSCGCILSKGEQKIQEILQNNNIIFETQKTFNDCRFPNTNCLARFDFWVNNNYIIEFDGEQHFQYSNYNNSWNTKEKFQIIQEHDKFKNQYCKNNNIPIIRIPYWHLNKLCFKDLKLETSKFIVI